MTDAAVVVNRKRAVREVPVPAGSLVADAFAITSYADAYAIDLPPGTHDVDSLARLLATSAPRWAERLMWLRNRVVSPFGLRTGGARITAPVSTAPILAGDSVGSFKVLARSGDEIMFGGDDKHLDFRASLLVQRDVGGSSAVLSTVVHYNNWFGRFYFFFVRPFHRLIVASLLRNLRRQVELSPATN